MNNLKNGTSKNSAQTQHIDISDKKLKDSDIVNLHKPSEDINGKQPTNLDVWKSFKNNNWSNLRTWILSLKNSGNDIIINSKDSIPSSLQSLVFYATKPINFPYETNSILNKLKLKDINLKSRNYNEFIISSYLYSLMKSSETKLIFIKNYDCKYILISCISQSFINIASNFKAIIGYGENYKPLTNIQYHQNEDRSWTITCKIVLSSEDQDRIKNYSIDNTWFNDKKVNTVKLLAGGSYASTSLIKEKDNDRHLVFKIAKGKGFAKLRDEILWLTNLPQKIKNFYPEVIDYNIDDDKEECWMNQLYYPWPSITSYLMNNGFNKFNNYYHNTTEILNFLIDVIYQNKELFYKHKLKLTTSNFFSQFHKDKIINRLIETQNMDCSFKKFIDAEYLILDGDKLLGPLNLIKCFEKINNITQILNPPYLCTLHGDLNIGNILVDPASFSKCYGDYSNLSIKFIDPRGWIDHSTKEFKGQDYMYDVAKIAYHFFGYYDEVRADMVNVIVENDENMIPKFSVTIPQYDKEKGEFTDSATKQYYHLQAAMLNYLIQEKDFLGLENNLQWKIRFMFTLGSCMISDIPFLLKGPDGIKKALAIFTLGTRFFNYAWEMIMKYFENTSDLTIKSVMLELKESYQIAWKNPINNSSIETILEDLGSKLSPICNLYSYDILEEKLD